MKLIFIEQNIKKKSKQQNHEAFKYIIILNKENNL